MDLPVAAGEMFPAGETPTEDVDVEIRQLIDRVTDEASSLDALRNLKRLVDYGMGGCISVLEVCLAQILSNAEELLNSELKQTLLSDIFKYCLSQNYFGICFHEALRPQTDTHNLFETTLNVLRLSQPEKVGIGLALLSDEDTSYGEVEADAYFHLVFSGQMSVNDLIRVLSLFKESLKERELSIFKCVISNLFEEYKLFPLPGYPEKQLKIAAALFGSLIKHQLLDHLGLEIAMRDVLDGLHKPADSRMFMFGTTALEQFIDCVMEWPMYCHEILQISHLREARIEMATAIEAALANTVSCLPKLKDFPTGISQNKNILLYSRPKKHVREMTINYLIQCDSSAIEKYTNKLLKDLELAENLILQEKQKLLELKSQEWKYPYSECQPDLFEKDLGYVINDLKKFPTTNDKTLKYMKDGLYENFSSDDDLLHKVKDLLEKNKTISKDAAILVSGYYDYLGRISIEMPWLKGVAKSIEEVCGLIWGYAPMFEELEGEISEQIKKVAVLSIEQPELVNIWKDIGLSSKKILSYTKDSEDLCLMSKNFRTLLIEKVSYATRFHITEQHLRANSSKVHKKLDDLRHEVEQTEVCYKVKMDGLEEVTKVPTEYEKIIVENGISWRTIKLHGKSILAPMRDQGRAMCAFVSSVAMTESLNRRHCAYYCQYSRSQYRPDVFVIKLSEYHLQDIVTAFYAHNKRKGSEKLEVCLERLRATGVVSEKAYDKANMKATGFARYRISDFDKLNPTRLEQAYDILLDGTVLIGTFAITKGYFSLGPNDVYDTKNGDLLETGPTGNTFTHAVVIVGYGMSPKGKAYYIFQNSYGPKWGKGGFGKVTCDSIRQLYAANL